MGYTNYIDPKKINKILIIKYRHLGDVLLATPVFHYLKKSISNAKIDALVFEEAKAILNNNPDIDEVLTYDRKIKKKNFLLRIYYEIKLIWRIRNRRYDLIINLTEGDRGAIIALFSKAKYKVGYAPNNKGIFKKEKIFTHLVKTPASKRHAVEKNLDAIRILGFFPKIEERRVVFQINQNQVESAKKLLKENNIKENEYILIHPNTRWRFKLWDKFDQLTKSLEKMGKKVVFVSSNDQIELDYVNSIIKDTKAINLSGKTTIEQLAFLIKSSELFISVDSFSYNLANVFKANNIVLFGPSCDLTWGPWQNENCQIIKKDISCRPCNIDGCGGSKKSECLSEISVEDVLKVISSKLTLRKKILSEVIQ